MAAQSSLGFFFLFSNAGSSLSYNAFNTNGDRYVTVTDNELSPCVWLLSDNKTFFTVADDSGCELQTLYDTVNVSR